MTAAKCVRRARTTTAATLGAVGALHIAWGRGSSFPLPTRTDLADAVVGADAVPPPAACYAVGGLLIAASIVVGTPIAPTNVRQRATTALAGILAIRGALGLAGRTDLVSPGSNSERFRRLDRRVYAPLCLALGAGSLTAAF